jgi:phosphonoacetaldehyde hydrolase
MPDSRLEAVVFDWAGTIVDHGSQAPMGAFVRAFLEFGIEITIDEARGPMGMAKRDHVKALLEIPRVAALWRERHGNAPDEADIDRVYDVFVPLNVAVVSDYATLIEGAAETVRRLRVRGLKIGSTTGYVREIMAPLLPLAAEQGYAPDNLVCAGDLSQGRPSPLMMWRTFLDLDVQRPWHVVKVDDTEVGIEEGLNAGCWSIGVAMTGNLFGHNPEETAALDAEVLKAKRGEAYARLQRSGAHAVIDSVADIEPVLDAIEGRLARGERP